MITQPTALIPRALRAWVTAGLVFLVAAVLAGALIRQTETASRGAERRRVADLAAVHTQALQAHLGQALSATDAPAALVQPGGGRVPDVDLPETLAAARLPELTQLGLGYELWRRHPVSGERQVIATTVAQGLDAPVEHTLEVPNGTWTLSVAPLAGWGAGPHLAIEAAMGLLFSLLLAYLVKLLLEAQTQRRGLTALVERRTAELHASEADLEHAQAVAQVGSWVLHPGTGRQRWSAEARRILGLAADTGLGARAFLRRVPRADRQAVTRIWQAARNGAAAEVEFRIDPGGGSAGEYRWVRVRTQAQGPGDDLDGHRVGTVQDITSHKQTQDALATSEARYRQIVEMANEGIWVIDLQGVTSFANARMAELLGCTLQSLIGRPFFDFMDAPGRRQAAIKLAERAAGIAAQHEFRLIRCDGSELWTLMVTTPLWDALGRVTHAMAMVTDVTAERRAAQEIERLAFYDPLTGLANRRLLLDRLARALVATDRSGRPGALLFIDLDDFKTLNDTLGHEAGDAVLQQAAQRMTGCVRRRDSVARLGGDEFIILLEELSDRPPLAAAHARAVGDKLLCALSRPYQVAGQDCRCTASIGITLFTEQDQDPEALLKRADLALYQAKAAGRNGVEFFDPTLQAALTARTALAAELRAGLQAGQFLLRYQPQVDGTGRLIGAAALTYWQHPRRGLLTPAEFIAPAQETGMILPLGHWVLRTAAAQLAVWGQRPATRDLTLTIEIGVRQFRQPDFVTQVLDALTAGAADPHRLRLELSEQLLLEPEPDTAAKVTALKAQGLGLALGGLGTGGSTLARLRQLPLDQVKIDRSFVSDLPGNPETAAITQAILALASSFGLAVIAEGVENEAQRAFFAAQGCEVFQGGLFGPPGPAAALEGNAAPH